MTAEVWACPSCAGEFPEPGACPDCGAVGPSSLADLPQSFRWEVPELVPAGGGAPD